MISAISDPFAVSNEEVRYIKIINPNAGTIMHSPMDYWITWESKGIDYVTIEYSTDRGSTWTSICGRVKSEGSYFWGVPAFVPGEMQIKIEEVAG